MDLPPQKRKILNLIACDMSNEEIGALINIDKCTVDNHIRRMLKILQVRSRVGAVMIGLQKGLIDPNSIQVKKRS